MIGDSPLDLRDNGGPVMDRAKPRVSSVIMCSGVYLITVVFVCEHNGHEESFGDSGVGVGNDASLSVAEDDRLKGYDIAHSNELYQLMVIDEPRPIWCCAFPDGIPSYWDVLVFG
jgi:hypothetical protein